MPIETGGLVIHCLQCPALVKLKEEELVIDGWITNVAIHHGLCLERQREGKCPVAAVRDVIDSLTDAAKRHGISLAPPG